MKYWIFLFLLLSISIEGIAQNKTGYGFKGGLSLGNQTWNSSERDFLIGWHGDVFMEAIFDTTGLSIMAQLGYHVKGSALRFREYYNPTLMEIVDGWTQRQPFHTVVLVLAAKNQHRLNDKWSGYYGIGIRGDYTIGYTLYYAGLDQFINRFNYGLYLVGGLNFQFKSGKNLLLEVSFSPDASPQIDAPPFEYFHPVTNMPSLHPAKRVINRTVELSLGYRFVRTNYTYTYYD